jgi:UDP-N-acetylglucosamine 2-epimerase
VKNQGSERAPLKLVSIVGARPQFIKLAPFCRAIERHNRKRESPGIRHLIIHSGQHYDYRMNKVFFDEMGIPEPTRNLGVGSGSHGCQTGEMLRRLEDVLRVERPDWTLVFGDTNTTLAGALAAAKLGLPLGHVEAGLRSYNRAMPEEINRVLVDHCSDILFCPTRVAVRNLKAEGFDRVLGQGRLRTAAAVRTFARKPEFPLVADVGDIMFDAQLQAAEIAGKKSRILEGLGLKPRSYYLATIHRAENTDSPRILRSLMATFSVIQARGLPIVFSLHPRTKKALKDFGLYRRVSRSFLLLDPPVGYFDMLCLEKNAAKILTDSGGVQKEAFLFRVPCVTLRSETEWTETVKAGFNTVAGTKKADILKAVAVPAPRRRGRPLEPYGRGSAAGRILQILLEFRTE